MEKDFLYSDRLPTLDEMKKLFKKNDWTTMKIDDPDKRTPEEWAMISYVARILDEKFEELVRKRGRISAAEYYSGDNPLIVLQKNTEDLVASAVVKEHDNRSLLKSEVVKSIRGESSFSTEMLSELIAESEHECERLAMLCEEAKEEVNDTENLLRELSDNFDELISWAELYDEASLEKKKMIVNLLINRIEVCSGYKVNIDFNLNFEQFLIGIDKVT